MSSKLDRLKKYRSEKETKGQIVSRKTMEEGAGAEPLSTGSLKLDRLLEGGFRRHCYSELYGAPQSGKTTVALKTAGRVMAAGGTVAWFDHEQALDIDLPFDELNEQSREQVGWMRKNGVDPYDEKFALFDWCSAEDFFRVLVDIVDNDIFDLAVQDSIAALVPNQVLEGDIADSHYGALARVCSNGFPRLMRAIARSKKAGNPGCHVMFLNQLRDNINSRFGGKKTKGGNALRHFSGYKCRLWKVGESEEENESWREMAFKVEKSRYCGAPRQTKFVISSERGVDFPAEIIDAGLKLGIVRKLGAWFYIYDRVIPLSPKEFKRLSSDERKGLDGFVDTVQGMHKAVLLASENEELQRAVEETWTQ